MAQQANFRQLLGGLRFLTDSTRPDLAFATSKLGAAAHHPAARHYKCLENTIKFVKHSQHEGLTYRRRTSTDTAFLDLYTDSFWVNDKADRKSQNRAVLLLNNNPVIWLSKKQDVVATSTPESEYIAFNQALKLLTFMVRLLSEIHVYEIVEPRAKIDNLPTIQMIETLGGTKRRKFMDLRHHAITDQLKRYGITLIHVPSDQMKADIMTKQLARSEFRHQRSRLNVCRPKPLI